MRAVGFLFILVMNELAIKIFELGIDNTESIDAAGGIFFVFLAMDIVEILTKGNKSG